MIKNKSMSNKKIVFFFLLPVLVSFILHFHVLKLDLIGYHVWRQTQTQTVIYHFNFSDNSIFHPQKFDLTSGSTSLLYEFPLYQWIVAQVNNGIGYSVTNTRIITFIIFIFLLWGFYKLLTKFVRTEIALVTNCLLCFSPLLYYYCINPLPDIMALCFSVWCLNAFFKFKSGKQTKHFLAFGFFLMLATLVKLPFILFGGVFILYGYNLLKQKKYKQILLQTLTLLIILIPALAWYIHVIPTWKGNGITSGLINNNKTFSELFDYFQFNLISSVPELLTNYASCIFLVVGIWQFFKNIKSLKENVQYLVLLFILLSVYFLFELNMIEKTHDYYLMPFIPLLFFVVAYGVKYFYQKSHIKFILFIALVVPLTAWLRIDTRWNLQDPGFVTDYMTEQKQIQSLIPENEKCIIDYDNSHFVSLYYLKRYGYSLFKEQAKEQVLKDRYLKGANYFITENLSINLEEYTEFDFEEVYSKNLRIYKLKLK